MCTNMCAKEKENATNDLKKERLSLHAGFAVLFDNIDGSLNRWHMTMENQNLDYHWVNHKIVITEYRVTNLTNRQEILLTCRILDFFPMCKIRSFSDITTLSWWQEF